MSTTRHLVIGATGFVGGALALELLARTGYELVCLVRGENDQAATRRLHDALGHAAVIYDRQDLLPAVLLRTSAVAGDITRADLPATARRIGPVSAIWHTAASLKYLDRDAEEITAINVGGVQNVLALAEALGRPVFNHVSTAYVAGKRTGSITESLLEDTQWANNVYEATKTVGERAVAESGLPWRILRPSIVVGHSVTRGATSFTGLYGFTSSMLRFKQAVESELGNFLTHRRIPILADPSIEADLVPVDLVASSAVTIGASGEFSRVYHLNNASSPQVGTVIREVFAATGLRNPQFVSSLGMLNALDMKLYEGIQFYASYMINGKHFDQANTLAVNGIEAVSFPMGPSVIRDFIRWYIERIHADHRKAAPKPASFAYKKRRQAADEPVAAVKPD